MITIKENWEKQIEIFLNFVRMGIYNMREIKELQELKNIELEIMKQVHNFCKDNNIRYYLSHGTLIGAIRHHGFIPWDDDIDIFMPRPDYKKFCLLFPMFAKKNDLELVNHETSLFFGRPMSKVIDKRTILIEAEYKDDNPIGVFIDVWPLDGAPSNSIIYLLQHTKCLVLMKLFYGNISKINRSFSIRKKVLCLFGRLFPRQWLLKMIIKYSQKYNYDKENKVACFVDPYQAVMEKQWFGSGKLMQFEDMEFYVPTNYDKVLNNLYGNYMELPPKDKQIPHHISNVYWKTDKRF